MYEADTSLNTDQEPLLNITRMYRFLSEYARDSIMFFDVAGQILEFNRTALQTYGYLREEMIGMNIDKIRSPETAHLIKAQMQQALNQGVMFETMHRRKDGAVFPVEVSAIGADLNGKRVIMSIVRDITLRVKADTELRKLSTAVEQSPCSVVITDINGNIEYVNPKFTQTTGYLPAEAIGKNPRILKSGHQPPAVYEEMWRAITAGEEWQGEFQNISKSGTLFWESASISGIRDATGKITHYLAIKEDITPRKHMEDSIRRDMELASRIQRGLLPADLDNRFLQVRTIYRPHHHVGGDLFGYSWDEKSATLSGYIADVMGHGVGTALQAAALRALFYQAEEQKRSPAETLRWINSRIPAYFTEDTFAAAVYFQFDFIRKLLVFAVAGINHLFAWSKQFAGLVTRPGIYLGIIEEYEYEDHTVNLHSGDSFIFLTDGLFDLIADRHGFACLPRGKHWDFLHALAAENKMTDDASALYIAIN